MSGQKLISRMLFFIVSIFLVHETYAKSAITYEFSGGRFGDNLLAYLHAKWLSYKYDIPLLYREFPYSCELVLDTCELSYQKESAYYFRKLRLQPDRPYPNPDKEILYICPYFAESLVASERASDCLFATEWADPTFRQMARALIFPKRPLSFIFPSKQTINVAIHLREGGGYDDKKDYFRHPLKTPPLDYYAESLDEVARMFEGCPIYCHLFTDSLEPEMWAEALQTRHAGYPPLQIHYRKNGNQHDKNVLEDFFSLFNFDVLIKSDSNYSNIVDYLNDFSVVVNPIKCVVQGKHAAITEKLVSIRQDPFNQLINRVLDER